MAETGQKLECDLVMRGGITSGIVYPRAIAKLAESYRFRSIGGTSAGAIAAAATAAGALGVREGKDPFQGRFKTLPEELARQIDKKTVLERVFQPAKGLERLFAVLLAGLQRMSFGRKVAAVLLSLCRHYRLYAAVGAAIVVIPLILAAWWLGLGRAAFAGLLAFDVLPLVLFAILGAATGLLFDVLFRLPKNDFGICTGSRPVDPANPDMPPQDDAGVAPIGCTSCSRAWQVARSETTR
ncbi:MAG TPA: patatin-like phospholipase family protein [Methyloceanibacter sp.]|nr:patatin-like phospholipase family protein [Methyloceanibacter sp.]